MSYVNKKIRLFKEAGDTAVARKRSEGRMKTYQSATDARAWCGTREERRQHILDLVRQGEAKGLSLGKYIPIEAIIDILLASKTADIKRLQREIEFLKKFIRDNGLTVPDFEDPGDEEFELVVTPSSGRMGGKTADGEDKDDPNRPGGPGDPNRPGGPGDSRARQFKTPEEEILALRQSLAEKEQLHASQLAVALAALQKLETIKGIVDEDDTGNVPAQPAIQPKSTTEESGLESDTTSPGDETVDSGGDLRRRLEKLEGLEDEVRKLKKTADTCVQPGGDTADREALLAKIRDLEREVDNLRHNLKEIEILRVERNCLKMRVEDLTRVQRDYEELLKKTQGFDALKAELATCKAKCEELKGLEAEVNELRIKCQRLDELENERQMLMKEVQDCECCMNNQDDEIKRLACHIECLTQDLDKRQDQMKVKVLTLRAHLEKKDNIIVKSEEQLASVQDQLRNSIESLSCETFCLRTRIEELEEEISRYQNSIREYENKITLFEEKIKEYENIGNLCDCKATEYENKIKDYENKLKLYEDTMREGQKRLEEYEDLTKKYQQTITAKEEKNKDLNEKLQSEKATTKKLEEALKKAIINDEHLKQLLKQAKCAIKCITQKLEKHSIVDIAKIELERENYIKKINELEGALRNLGSGDGSEDQDKLTALIEENEALKNLVKQLQESAKGEGIDQIPPMEGDCEELRRNLMEKQKIIEELENELSLLKEELDKEQQLKELVESMPKDGIDPLEFAKLQQEINILNAEIDRLTYDLTNARRKSEALEHTLPSAKESIRDLDKQNANLKAEISDLTVKVEELMLEIDRLKKENEILKAEMERLKSASGAAEQLNLLNDKINQLQQELDAKNQEIKELKDEINKLKEELNKLEQQQPGTEKGDDQNLRDEINKLKQELADKENIANENKNLKDEINRLQQQLASQPASGKGDQELQDQINKLKQELAAKQNIEDQNKKLQDELNTLKASEGKEPDSDFNKERDDLLQQIAAQKKEIADLLGKMKEPSGTTNDAVLQEKDKENNKLKDTIAALEKQLKALEKPDSMQQELQDQMNENEKLKNIITDLQNQLKAMKEASSDAGAAQKAIEDKNNENEKLKKSIADLEQQLKDLKNAQLDAIPAGSPEIEKVINDLRQNLEKEEQKNKELEEALRKCQEEGENLKNTIATLKAQGSADAKAPDAAGDDYKKRCEELEAQLAKKTEEYNNLTASLEKYNEPGSEEDYKAKCMQLEAELAKQKEECNEMISSLKAQYDRDIKNLRRQSDAAIDQLQETQQQALDNLSKQHDDETSLLKNQLIENMKRRRSSASAKVKPKEKKSPDQSLASVTEEPETSRQPSIAPIEEEKQDENKTSKKTSGDVCICGKLPSLIPIAPPTQPVYQRQAPEIQPFSARAAPVPAQYMPLSDTYGDPRMPIMAQQAMAPLPSQAAEERLHSIKKLVELENKLLLKQQFTKQKIDQLQNTVDQLKRELELEKQRNGDLMSRYTNQSKTVENMKVEIDLVKKENYEDKRRLQHLNSTLKNVLQGRRMICPCVVSSGHVNIPHFHTELSYAKLNDNRYKQTCVSRRGTCSCSSGDKSVDSFEIEE